MPLPTIRATTILAVRRDGKVAIGGDGQVTVGDTVMKAKAQKVRALQGGKLLTGFAGSAADALTLFDKFEEKLTRFPGNLPRAVVDLAKEWRSDRVLRRLEAMLIVADVNNGYIISGNGEVIEPDDGILAIGSGGPYALSAARALAGNTSLAPREIVEKALEIAGESASTRIQTSPFSTPEPRRAAARDGHPGRARRHARMVCPCPRIIPNKCSPGSPT